MKALLRMHSLLLVFLLAALLTAPACSRSDSPPASDKAASVGPLVQDPTEKATSAPSSSDVEMKGSISQAREEAAQLDGRMAVPMLPRMSQRQKQNMRAHLESVQRIIGALAREDWEEVTAASKEIGSSNGMRGMCGRMGRAAPAMAQMGRAFHEQADGITEAASGKDVAGTLAALSSTVQVCTGCHAAFRQDVVDLATYEERLGALRAEGESGGAQKATMRSECGCDSARGEGCPGGCRGQCDGGCRGRAKSAAP